MGHVLLGVGVRIEGGMVAARGREGKSEICDWLFGLGFCYWTAASGPAKTRVRLRGSSRREERPWPIDATTATVAGSWTKRAAGVTDQDEAGQPTLMKKMIAGTVEVLASNGCHAEVAEARGRVDRRVP
jgi:hypothetical protein